MLVTFQLEDRVAVIHLADPDRRNALSKEMSDDLETAVSAVLADGARALVLAAEPPVFCAGGSLDNLLSGTFPLEVMFAGYTAVARAPVPTIAAVGGPALGAGFNLALACDVVVASPAARFESRFLDIGMHPGGGHLWWLVQRMGRQAAAAMVLFGEPLTAEEAVAAGLAWRCVPDADLEPFAVDLARRAARRPPDLSRRAKETLRLAAGDLGAEAAFDREMQEQRWSMAQPEFHEAVGRVQRQISDRKRAPGPL